MSFAKSRLRWKEVAPVQRLFDFDLAEEMLEPILEEAVLSDSQDHDQVEERIDQALVQEFGAWLKPWRSASTGGPISAYNAAHGETSLMLDDPEDADLSIILVLAAVAEWQAFLEELDRLFAEIASDRLDDFGADVERGASRLLPLVVRRTKGRMGWHDTFAQVVEWYIGYCGFKEDRYSKTVRDVVTANLAAKGKPEPFQSALTCLELGIALNRMVTPPAP